MNFSEPIPLSSHDYNWTHLPVTYRSYITRDTNGVWQAWSRMPSPTWFAHQKRMGWTAGKHAGGEYVVDHDAYIIMTTSQIPQSIEIPEVWRLCIWEHRALEQAA